MIVESFRIIIFFILFGIGTYIYFKIVDKPTSKKIIKKGYENNPYKNYKMYNGNLSNNLNNNTNNKSNNDTTKSNSKSSNY